MTSILTNVAAMSALQTLRAISTNLEQAQSRVSSGKSVATASDNAAYWSIATTMKSDNSALSAVEDALGLGASKVDTAYAAMESAVDVVTEIKNRLVAAREASVDKEKIQEEISQLQGQLKGLAESASFSGENWLQLKISDGTGNLAPVTKQIVASFIRDSGGNVSVQTADVVIDHRTALFDLASGDVKTGILDSNAYYSESGAYTTVAITTTGTPDATKVVAAKVFTEAQLKASITDPVADFTTDPATGIVTIANPSADAIALAGNYFKIGNDQYVKLADPAPTDKSAIGKDTTGAGVYLDEAAGNLATQLSYSVSTLDITRDLVGPTGVVLTVEEALDAMISFVDYQLEAVVSATADLGSISMRIGLQEDFISKLTDSIDRGIGRLVDADMNEESTRLKALQTQQQLAIQALSIANTSSENVLRLFQ